MDSISEARLQLVCPALADKIHRMAEMLAQEKIEIRVVQGLRTVVEQNALYRQGRSTPGKIVTNCKGGDSYHNYGLAGDCVPSQFAPDQPYNPDWHPEHPTWKHMESIGQSLGLTVGAMFRTFPDAPHFQLNGRFPEGEPNAELKQIFQSDGMDKVWSSLDQGGTGDHIVTA